MQRGRGGRDDLSGGFGDPFGGFPGMGGRPGSLISSFFGGRDPFDDPFFTQPFGGVMGPSMFGPSMFGPQGNLFGQMSNAGFLEQQAPPPPSRSRGPIIEEISSDVEEEDDKEVNKHADKKKESSRKHSRSSKEPYVHDPDEDVGEKKSRSMQYRNEYRNDYNRTGVMRPQAQTYSFHSSTVTYGGTNGTYYTASTTRKMGGDGVVMEESKEADSTTGRAAHRVSRGIHDKGHTVMRKLNSDGRVDSLQTLHNLNEDELTGFNEVWKGKARQHLPGWNQGHDILDNSGTSGTGSNRDEQLQRGWALPSTAQTGNARKGKLQSQSNSFGPH